MFYHLIPILIIGGDYVRKCSETENKELSNPPPGSQTYDSLHFPGRDDHKSLQSQTHVYQIKVRNF